MIWLDDLLESDALWLLARILGTFFFWWAGIGFVLDQEMARAAMAANGAEPAWLMAILVPAVQLIGSAIVILGRYVWFGAGMLGVFTIATIFLVHDFWTMTGPARQQHYLEAQEHVTVLGGLLALSILAHIRRAWAASREGV